MDTMRALRQVIMFKDVPEPVLETSASSASILSADCSSGSVSPYSSTR